MSKVSIFNMIGEQTGEMDLNDNIFGIKVSQYAVHEAVKSYLANQRQGTQSAKTRSEVRGGGRKPYRQKGTGRARQGSNVSPNHVGGGIVFAPKPRDYSYTIPKKLKRLAMKSVFTSKVADKEMIVLEDLKMEAPKTKEMVKVLSSINADKKALIVMDQKDENVIRSAANIPGVKTTLVTTLNVYDIINHNSFIVTKDAVHKIEEVYA